MIATRSVDPAAAGGVGAGLTPKARRVEVAGSSPVVKVSKLRFPVRTAVDRAFAVYPGLGVVPAPALAGHPLHSTGFVQRVGARGYQKRWYGARANRCGCKGGWLVRPSVRGRGSVGPLLVFFA